MENKKKKNTAPTREERLEYTRYYVPSHDEQDFLEKVMDVMEKYLSRYDIKKLHWSNEHEVFVFGLYGEKKVKLLGVQNKRSVSITITFTVEQGKIQITGKSSKLGISFSGAIKKELKRGFINYKQINLEKKWTPGNIFVSEIETNDRRFNGTFNSTMKRSSSEYNASEDSEEHYPIPDYDFAGEITELDDCGDSM